MDDILFKTRIIEHGEEKPVFQFAPGYISFETPRLIIGEHNSGIKSI